MWFSVLTVIIAAVGVFVSVVALLQLRAFLMVAFPSLVVRRLPEGFSPPAATADLYEKAAAELTALGFSSPQWIVIAPEKETPGIFAVIVAVFCHAEKNALVFLSPPLNIEAPNELTTGFITRLADGRKLTSQVRNIIDEAVADEKHPAQTIGGETLAEQWVQHQRWVEGFNTPAAAGFGTLETLSEELQGTLDVDVRLVNAGKFWRDAQGFARPTLAFALRFLRLYWTRPKPQANRANVPLARQTMLAVFNEHWQKRSLPVRWQWLLLAVSSVLIVALGVAFLGLIFPLAFLCVLLLYEGAHYLVMRALGYRHAQTPRLPLFGGVTFGAEHKPNATQCAWAAMVASLPGVMLGWGLLYFAFASGFGNEASSTIALIAVVLLSISYLALLPIPLFDGAHIVQALLPPRWLIARTVLVVAVCVAAAAIAAYFELYLLVGLALFPLLWLPSLLVGDNAVRLLATDASFSNAPPDQQRRRALETLQQCAGKTTNMMQRLQQIQTVVTVLTQTAMNWKHRTTLAALYIGLLSLPLMFLAVVATKRASEQAFLGETIFASVFEVPDLFTPPLAKTEQQKQAQQRIFLSLGGMGVPQLLARMPEPERPAPTGARRLTGSGKTASPPPLPDPADPRQMAAAQHRLGVIFPDDYRELLLLHDGYPPLRILPVAHIQRLSETDFFSDEGLRESQTFYSFAFPPSFDEADTGTVPGQRVWRNEELQSCAVIGGLTNVFASRDKKPTEIFPMLLWCSAPAFEQARIISLGESLWAPDFVTYLRYKVTQRIAAQEPANGDRGGDRGS